MGCSVSNEEKAIMKTVSCGLSVDTINPRLKAMRYAVRGKLVLMANQFAKELKEGKKFRFNEIVFCNIGNPQALGQIPISFFRQVLSLCINKDLMNNDAIRNSFPLDTIQRAENYLSRIPGGVGAYSNSRGVDVVREEVVSFVQERDGGVPCDINNIFLTDGASSGVANILKTLIRDENDGIMIPIPQYPLYSASITLNGGKQVSYYLEEEKQWALSMNSLESSYEEACMNGICVRALCVINPGNPTGACLTEDTMQQVIKFCVDKKLVLLADEVYQTNIYIDNMEFHSFKKVAYSMEQKYHDLMLVSFHSVSKGFLGECGLRGGYMEIINLDQEVMDEIYKLASISLCSNLIGQLQVGMMVNPPKEGEPSYEVYSHERNTILESLRRRATKVNQALSELEGVSSQVIEGALYAFPTITLPPKAVAKAKEIDEAADFYYCMRLLEEIGLVVVPGSGFGQVNGTWHFRTTILPAEEKLVGVIERLKTFHSNFMNEFRD